MTSVVLPREHLPSRLTRLGWTRTLRLRGVLVDAPRSVAIVGARAASGDGMARAHAVAKHLAGRGVHVVSGGALGIDGAAHRGALAGGGTTTVVLGTGADVAYPSRHAALFTEVLANGGGLLSMRPDGSLPVRGCFTSRNELISALADAVLVIEAEVRSGSLSTATAALKHQRIVAAWPGTSGCDRLIAAGAGMLEDLEDVELVLAGTPRERPPVTLDPIAQHVLTAMESGAGGVDDVVRMTGLTVRQVLRALPLIEVARKP